MRFPLPERLALLERFSRGWRLAHGGRFFFFNYGSLCSNGFLVGPGSLDNRFSSSSLAIALSFGAAFPLRTSNHTSEIAAAKNQNRNPNNLNGKRKP